MEDLKLFFSFISGDLYYVSEDEIKNLDKSQMPLLKKPDSSCKKCYGRFYVGFEPNKKYYIPCPRCMKKCVDWNAMKEDPVVETAKSTTEMADDEFNKAVNDATFVK